LQREAIDLAKQRWATETFRSYRRSLQKFSDYLTRRSIPWEMLLEKPKALAEVGNFIAWAEQSAQWSHATLRMMKGQLKQVFRMGNGTGGEELLDLVARGMDRSTLVCALPPARPAKSASTDFRSGKSAKEHLSYRPTLSSLLLLPLPIPRPHFP
jgi:hypothetical protein